MTSFTRLPPSWTISPVGVTTSRPGDVPPGDAVLDGLAAAGVLGHVAADEAGLQAHRVAGVEQADS